MCKGANCNWEIQLDRDPKWLRDTGINNALNALSACATDYEPSMRCLQTPANHVGSLKTGLYHSRDDEWKHCREDHTRLTITNDLLQGKHGSLRSDLASTHKWARHVLNEKDVEDGCDEMCKVGQRNTLKCLVWHKILYTWLHCSKLYGNSRSTRKIIFLQFFKLKDSTTPCANL